MKMTTLYRAYSLHDELLYIGISKQAVTRFDQHKETSAWFNECAYMVLQHFQTRQEAHAAEVVAIENEKPRFNIAHKAVA